MRIFIIFPSGDAYRSLDGTVDDNSPLFSKDIPVKLLAPGRGAVLENATLRAGKTAFYITCGAPEQNGTGDSDTCILTGGGSRRPRGDYTLNGRCDSLLLTVRYPNYWAVITL